MFDIPQKQRQPNKPVEQTGEMSAFDSSPIYLS